MGSRIGRFGGFLGTKDEYLKLFRMFSLKELCGSGSRIVLDKVLRGVLPRSFGGYCREFGTLRRVEREIVLKFSYLTLLLK